MWIGTGRSLVDTIANKVFGGEPASGQQTVSTAGTAESLQQQSVPKGAQVAIKALSGNNGTVYVGGSNVSSSNGFELAPKETLTYSASEVSNIYVDADTAGDGVCWTVETDK